MSVDTIVWLNEGGEGVASMQLLTDSSHLASSCYYLCLSGEG